MSAAKKPLDDAQAGKTGLVHRRAFLKGLAAVGGASALAASVPKLLAAGTDKPAQSAPASAADEGPGETTKKPGGAFPARTFTSKRYVRLAETDELLINPGMGISTFDRLNDVLPSSSSSSQGGPAGSKASGARAENGYSPQTSVAYFRWYWTRIEPEEGAYRWDLIDRAIEEAGKQGQQLLFRIMPHGQSSNLPDWYSRRGHLLTYGPPGRRQIVIPDYHDPLFRSATEKLVGLLGERYDGHPQVCGVDIGTLGYWGEWHCYTVPEELQPMGDEAVHRWAIDIYLNAFKRTPLMMNIWPLDAAAYAVSRGTGWRADCWGDTHPSWGFMYERYPAAISLTGAGQAWRKAPVGLEVGWTMREWFRDQWDLDYILAEALRWHVTHVNLKSTPVPEAWREKVIEFQKRVGYRYVLRVAGCTPAAQQNGWIGWREDKPLFFARGGMLHVEQWWVNRGVAPCYADYRLLLRLRGARDIFVEMPDDLRRWMPGDDQYVEADLPIPADLPAGAYELHVAIVRPGEKTSVVKSANKDRDDGGWVRIGPVEITA